MTRLESVKFGIHWKKAPETYSRTFRRDTVQQYVYTPLLRSDFYGYTLKSLRKKRYNRTTLTTISSAQKTGIFPWDLHWDRALGDDFGSGLAACTGDEDDLVTEGLVVRWATKKRRVGWFFVENSSTSSVFFWYLGIMKSKFLGILILQPWFHPAFLVVQVFRWLSITYRYDIMIGSDSGAPSPSNADHQEVFHFFGRRPSLVCHDCESRGGILERFVWR